MDHQADSCLLEGPAPPPVPLKGAQVLQQPDPFMAAPKTHLLRPVFPGKRLALEIRAWVLAGWLGELGRHTLHQKVGVRIPVRLRVPDELRTHMEATDDVSLLSVKSKRTQSWDLAAFLCIVVPLHP